MLIFRLETFRVGEALNITTEPDDIDISHKIINFSVRHGFVLFIISFVLSVLVSMFRPERHHFALKFLSFVNIGS